MSSSAYKREYPHLYRGVVESNIDPENMGRCKIRVPFIHGDLTYPVDALPWARPIVVSPVKSGRGTVNLPDKGDIVWVFFEGAVKEFPVYIGGTYAKGEIDTNPDIVDFYIENEDKISYNRKTRNYTIDINGIRLILTPDEIHMDLKDGTQIVSTLDNLSISAPKNITINAGGSISMKAPKIYLN